jgi:hypothetical protein
LIISYSNKAKLILIVDGYLIFLLLIFEQVAKQKIKYSITEMKSSVYLTTQICLHINNLIELSSTRFN